ncbi:hypothetical protein R3I93_021322 [Phoxinus phoxinus]|uniref:Uncharacterized protein n=1 Tax=Phoxinus phoxinus TaxID=58324 RepID=A0AAN9C9L6_9TELE
MNLTESQEMNGADEEESVIYANADVYDDVRTGTEDSDAKRLPCAGSDSVWNRMHGAVLVCLVLLCVLLLTVIIVLRVQLNAETHQHQMNNDILIQQRQQLIIKNTKIEKERGELLRNNTDLEKERDKLKNEMSVLKDNENKLLSTIDNFKNENQKTNQSKTNMTSTTSNE